MEERPTLLEDITQPPLSKELGYRCTAAFACGTLPMGFAVVSIALGKCLGNGWLQPLGMGGIALGGALGIVMTSQLMLKPLPGDLKVSELNDLATAKRQLGKTTAATVLVLVHHLAGMGLATHVGSWTAQKMTAVKQPANDAQGKNTQTGAMPQLIDPALAR